MLLKFQVLGRSLFSVRGLPEAERAAASILRSNLTMLEFGVHQFECNIRLIAFAEEHFRRNKAVMMFENPEAPPDPRPYQEIKDTVNIMLNWPYVAARDAALTIHHFALTRNAISAIAQKTKSISKFYDRQILKSAGKLFRERFPDAEMVRDAVAHSGERILSEEAIHRHSFSGELNAPGFQLSGFQNTFTHFTNRQLLMSWRGRAVSLDCSEDALDDLIEVLNLIMLAFEPVTEALRQD
jgi:hypothetical protein